MAFYLVAVVSEDRRPLAGVEVEAISLSAFPDVSAVRTTGRNGTVLFTGLGGPHWFHPRLRRTSGEVGGRSYTGKVDVQIIGIDQNCVDYVVDADGGGTHTTLAGAVAAALSSNPAGISTIWVCGSVTGSNIEIGGLTGQIIITSSDKRRVTITPNNAEDIFVQNSFGTGSLIFRNIGLAPDGGDSRAVLQVNTTSELSQLIFEDCHFSTANIGYLARTTGLTSLGAMALRVADCTGSLAGFYLVDGLSGTLAPDILEVFDSRLTLTRWWQFSTNSDPNSLIVQGGHYVVANGLDIGGGDAFFWKALSLQYTGTGAAFTTAAGSSQINDLMFDEIVFRVSQASAYFGEFGSAAVNNNNGLFLKNIYGYPLDGITPTATNFINVDTDYLNVHAGNLMVRGGWTNIYTGPNGGYTGDHGTLGGRSDDDHLQYAFRDAATDYFHTILADSPAAFWRLGETSGQFADRADDADAGTNSLGAHPGTVNGTITRGVAGTIANDPDLAITPNGTTGYVSVADHADLDFGDTFTLEAWIRKAVDGTFMSIIAKGTNAYQIRMADNNTLQLLRENVALIVSSTITITGTGWHHVAVTKTGATVVLYIDGVNVTGVVTNQTFTNTSTSLHIGRRVAAADEFFNGSIDEVAVYPTALSAARIRRHYIAGLSSLDHDTLIGLADDDHTQYVLRSILTTRGDLFTRDASAIVRLGVGAAGSILRSDGTDPSWTINPTIAGYMRVGSTSVPDNTTAGDLTAIRGHFGADAAQLSLGVDVTPTGPSGLSGGAGIYTAFTATPAGGIAGIQGLQFQITINPTANSPSRIGRGFVGEISHVSGNFTLGSLYGGQLTAANQVVGGTAALTDLVGLLASVLPDEGTVTNARGVDIFIGDGSINGTVTLAQGINIRGRGSTSSTFTVTTQVGIDIAGITGATNNFGIRNANNMVQAGYLRLGAITAPTNTTDGHLTAVGLILGNTVMPNSGVLIGDPTITDTSSTAKVANTLNATISNGSTNVAAQYIIINMLIATLGSASGNLTDSIGLQCAVYDLRHRSTGVITRFAGTRITGGPDGLTQAASGNITTMDMIEVAYIARNASTATVTTWRGLLVSNLTLGAGPSVVTTAVGIDIAALSGAGTIIGIRNASTSVFTPSTAQNITAVTATILANATVVQLTADASYTLTSAPTVADGQNGQVLIIVNVDTVDTITIQDQGTLASSNLRLSATTIALAPRDSIILMYSNTVADWVEIGQTNVL